MLKIRLRRTGAKKQPRYRVVVAESSAPRDGAFVEVIGWYNPQANPTQIVVDSEKAAAWIAKGAQPSERVANLLKRAQSGGAAPAAEPAPAAAPAVATAEPPASEAPESEGSAGLAAESES